MRRFYSVLAVLALVIILVVTEIVIIKSASKYEPQAEAVFAKTRIPERTKIAPEMLEVRKVARSFVHRMSLTAAADAVEKYAGVDIEAGEMILSGKLNDAEQEAVKVKDADKRLFSVEFKGDQANGWWLMPDQRVNIIYVPDERREALETGNLPESGGKAAADSPAESIARGVRGKVQVLENIRIAALIDANGVILKNTGRASLPQYVSFEVTDEQAGLLAYAKGHGRLELSVIPDGG